MLILPLTKCLCIAFVLLDQVILHEAFSTQLSIAPSFIAQQAQQMIHHDTRKSNPFQRHGRARGYHVYHNKMKQSSQSEMETSPSTLVPGRPTWQQTMLRIADPSKSIPFYTNIMGMTLIDTFDFPQYDFSLYFLATLPKGEVYELTPGTKEAHDYLWSMDGTTLELTHNYGTEDSSNFNVYHPGNQERDGFGHIAFSCDDVYKATEHLETLGVDFKKKPDEGRMKGLAFAYDPDGYWVELVKRPLSGQISNMFNLSQTMIRVKDPQKSLAFYQNLGMTLLSERHFDDFSLFYLASDLEHLDEVTETCSDEAKNNAYMKFGPLLELTHNHGTEKEDTDFEGYWNGNEDGRQGFGHVGFLVDDVYKACDSIGDMGYGFRKEPDGGSMKGLAFAYDPDGYSVEIIKRGGIEFGDKKVGE